MNKEERLEKAKSIKIRKLLNSWVRNEKGFKDLEDFKKLKDRIDKLEDSIYFIIQYLKKGKRWPGKRWPEQKK